MSALLSEHHRKHISCIHARFYRFIQIQISECIARFVPTDRMFVNNFIVESISVEMANGKITIIHLSGFQFRYDREYIT